MTILILFIVFSSFSSNSKTEDKRKITMSYNFIDKGSFFKIPDEYSNISHAIDTLQKPVLVNWPCSREEEVCLN